jgi:pterin-4a-carbinolamine dehydratase
LWSVRAAVVLLDRAKVQTETTAASADCLCQRLLVVAVVVAEMVLLFRDRVAVAVVARAVSPDKRLEQEPAAKDRTAARRVQTQCHIAVLAVAVLHKPEQMETLARVRVAMATHSAMAIHLQAAAAAVQLQAAAHQLAVRAAVATAEVLPQQLAAMAEHIRSVVKPLAQVAVAVAQAARVAGLVQQRAELVPRAL